MLKAVIELASEEGIFAAPEVGACAAALRKLLAAGFLKGDKEIVIHPTGSGLKFLEAYTEVPRSSASGEKKLGGR